MVVFLENIGPVTTRSFPPVAIKVGEEEDAAWTVGVVEGADVGLGIVAAATSVARIYAGVSEE